MFSFIVAEFHDVQILRLKSGRSTKKFERKLKFWRENWTFFSEPSVPLKKIPESVTLISEHPVWKSGF